MDKHFHHLPTYVTTLPTLNHITLTNSQQNVQPSCYLLFSVTTELKSDNTNNNTTDTDAIKTQYAIFRYTHLIDIRTSTLIRPR